MSTTQAQTVRRFVMTGSVAAITATGAWYGAGLKTQQEFKQVSVAIQRECSLLQMLTCMPLGKAETSRGRSNRTDRAAGESQAATHKT